MKYVTRIFIYLLLTTTMVVFGYEVIKFARDQVRISNINSLSRVIMYLAVTEGNIPLSGPNSNVSQHLYEKKLMDKEVRDPVFTSATVILDEYALMLVNLYEKISKATDLDKAQDVVNEMKTRMSTIFDDEQTASENVERIKALLNDENVQNNYNELKKIMDIDDDELDEFLIILKDANLRRNIQEIKRLASQPVPPECVLVYAANPKNDEYELSVKLESRFLQNKMRQDGGNDDARYEIGNNLNFDTSLQVYGSKVRANSRSVSVIK